MLSLGAADAAVVGAAALGRRRCSRCSLQAAASRASDVIATMMRPDLVLPILIASLLLCPDPKSVGRQIR